jgi:hypothetical protein
LSALRLVIGRLPGPLDDQLIARVDEAFDAAARTGFAVCVGGAGPVRRERRLVDQRLDVASEADLADLRRVGGGLEARVAVGEQSSGRSFSSEMIAATAALWVVAERFELGGGQPPRRRRTRGRPCRGDRAGRLGHDRRGGVAHVVPIAEMKRVIGRSSRVVRTRTETLLLLMLVPITVAPSTDRCTNLLGLVGTSSPAPEPYWLPG